MFPCKSVDKSFSIDGFFSAFRFDWNDSFVFDGESHDFWEIILVLSGEVEVVEDNNVYTLRAGNMMFHAPMEFHRSKSSGGTSPSGRIMSFRAIGEIPSVLTQGIFSLDEDLMSDYNRVFENAADFFDGVKDCGFEATALLEAFIAKLSKRLQRGSSYATNPLSMTPGATEYRKIVSFMSRNVCQNLSLTEIAAKNSVSVSYLKLLFNTYAGISPKKYFNSMRLRHATKLLSEGNSVIEVSDTMNFSSPNYFSYFYK